MVLRKCSICLFRVGLFQPSLFRLVLWLLSASVLSPFMVYADSSNEDDWFDRYAEIDLDEINEGELRFIPAVSGKPILSTEAELMLTESSLHDGMVSMQQCYFHIDPVPELDITYRFPAINQLVITSTKNIGIAMLSGQTVQLEDIKRDASICVTARIRVLEKMADGNYQLTSGPYYRRFLDGYYPYHVQLQVSYPGNRLSVQGTNPAPQQHFNIESGQGNIVIDTWFEGELTIKLMFKAEGP